MKLDKDTLVKHQFWFLLGTFFLVWVIAVFWLKVAAGEPIQKAQKAHKDAETKLKNASNNPKNPTTFCPPWQDYSADIDKHKQSIWGQAWDLQNGMYDWPAKLGAGKDMSTPQTELSQSEREEFRRTLYPEEVNSLKDAVVGNAKKGLAGLLGPVELAGGFDNIFKPQKLDDTPTREECWLIQEDYWVKRELFWVINYAMTSQSYMYPDTEAIKEAMPPGVLYRFRFRNQNWELTLHIKADKDKLLVIAGDSTIKNIQPSRHVQSLTSAKGAGIVFNVFQDKTLVPFEVRGEPVPWGTAQKLNPEGDYSPSKGIDWAKAAKAMAEKEPKEHALFVSQAFDWPTSPIRRVEAIAIGQQSCRTFASPLQPNETLVKLDAPKPDPADANKAAPPAAGPAGPGGMGGRPMGAAPSAALPGASPMGASGGMAGQKTAALGNPTPNNGIERNRYLQAPKKDAIGQDANGVENPSRHLPLALQLLVDQAHVSDILVALANSRLRFQITQVELHRVRDVKQADADKTGGGNHLLHTGMMPPGMMSPRMMPPGRGNPKMNPGMMPPGRGNPRMPPSTMTPGGGNPRMNPGGGYPRMPAGMRGTPMRMPTGIMTPAGMPSRPPFGRAIPSTGDSDKNKTPSQGDENLVEMTIYGVATLYRRPDPPLSESPTGQSAQPGSPLPTTPAAAGGAKR